MRIVSAQFLRLLIPAHAPCITADANYAVPTLAWLQGPFWDWWKEQRWGMGLDKWDRRNDCDNFSRAFAQAAADCHALTKGSEDAEGLAVGEFYYHSPRGPHAIVAVENPDSDSGLVFIEPQNGQILTLTPQEIQSCFFARW